MSGLWAHDIRLAFGACSKFVNKFEYEFEYIHCPSFSAVATIYLSTAIAVASSKLCQGLFVCRSYFL